MSRIPVRLLTISEELFRPRDVWFERLHELRYRGRAEFLRNDESVARRFSSAE